MIRIDEIYYNVFVPKMQKRKFHSAHWFDPFGSVEFRHLMSIPAVSSADSNDPSKPNFLANRYLFWDQEPLYQETVDRTLTEYKTLYGNHGSHNIVTSEKNSEIVDYVCNTYKFKPYYYFFHGWAALDWYRGYNHTYLAPPFARRKFNYAFMCPNNIIGGNRIHRVKFLYELVQRDLLGNNLISFPEYCPYEKENVYDLANKCGVDLSDIDFPLIIDSKFNHAGNSHKIDFWEQGQKSFAHVVTETVYLSNKLHLTEKTFKPIVMQQPFLLIAPRGSLSYLREYGFRTFNQIWDEGYDDLDDSKRMSAVADICQQINNWTTGEMQDAIDAIDSTVRHNHNWFYGGFQDLLWHELDEMVKQW